jgi:CheY-like chemotaxis protein
MPVAEKKLLQVLVVDDNRDTTDVMARLVSRWGHEAQRAYDGAAALCMAAHQAPDVVLLDIAMPNMDGCQVAERLRGDARLRDCFLIAMTACAEMANRLRCRDAGIDLFLIKPVDSSLLETLLDLECTRLGRSRRARGVSVSRPRLRQRDRCPKIRGTLSLTAIRQLPSSYEKDVNHVGSSQEESGIGRRGRSGGLPSPAQGYGGGN